MKNIFRRAALLAFLTTCAVSRTAGGQASQEWRRCLDSLPDKDLVRVAAFLVSDADRTAPSVTKAADLLVDIVARKLRSLLGASAEQLPMGEPLVTRRTAEGSVEVTLHKDGRFTGRIVADSTIDSARAGGARLIERALNAVIDDGERMFWPEKGDGDSATFKISFVTPYPMKDGTPGDPDVRFGSVVFSLALPWAEPASVKKLARPVYPQMPLQGMSQGFVILDFTIDEHGKVDRSTIRDLWPPDQPRLTGALADYYRSFVNAAKFSIEKTQYNPAIAVRCAFPQHVQQPFDFAIRAR